MNWRNVQQADPLLGETLDERFRIEGLLGQGGMGRVYEGRQLSVDRPVAIKIIRTGIVEPAVRDRFLREARVLSGLSHPNLVRLIDFGIQDERPYLVMEKVGGITLQQLLQRGRLRVALAIEVVRQMSAGLAAAHAAGVVHRDLKPENVHLLTSPDGTLRVKILDFGLAFPTDTEERLTKTGQVNGTPRYMAPEQARSGTVDHQADLYSVGIILYEMLTGTPPFKDDSTLRVMMKHVRETPTPITEQIPADTFPKKLHSLIDALLAKQPSDRPESAREVRKRVQELERHVDLEQIEVGEGISIEEATERWVLGPNELDPMSVQASQSRSRRHLMIGAAAAVGVFALILGAYLFTAPIEGDTAPLESSPQRPSGDRQSTESEAAGPAPIEAKRREASPTEKSDQQQDPLFEWPPESSEDSLEFPSSPKTSQHSSERADRPASESSSPPSPEGSNSPPEAETTSEGETATPPSSTEDADRPGETHDPSGTSTTSVSDPPLPREP